MKDYRCKDCSLWKEYGEICTYGIYEHIVPFRASVKHTKADNKKCKHFKLEK